MVSLLKEQENFLRNAILTVDHSKEVLQCFIEQHLENNHQTFEDFLNQNQHDIYHLHYDAKCCQCGLGPMQRKKRILFASQMKLLFIKNRQLSVHKTTRHGDFCCCYAQKSVTTSVLDLTLARCLLMNCCIDMFWYSCLDFKGLTLEQFLNSNKHMLYHLWKNNTKCCKCQPDFIFPCNTPLIMESEWKKMFSSTLPPCENDRKRPVNGAISICAFSATPSITVQQIHLELQGIIIQYCCSTRKSVEKLAELRNVTFGHVKKASMSCTEFNTFMSEAEHAILDLAIVCGKEDYYRQMLLDLRDKPLDTRMFCQYEKVLLQTMSNYEDIIKENEVLTDGMESLKNSNAEMKENIERLCILQTEGSKRQRLIGETSVEIDNHRKDQTYTEIKAVTACVQMLANSNVLILTGREGSGKSKNSLEILRRIKEKHPETDVIKLKRLTQFSDIIKEDALTVVLFEDVFGRITKQFCENTDEPILDSLYSNVNLGNVKVIFVMRNTVKHECQSVLSSHDIFCNNIAYLDLNSEEFRLSLKEKESILINYCTKNEIDIIYKDDSFNRKTNDISIDKIKVSIIDKPDFSCRLSADNKCLVFNSQAVEDMLMSDPYQGFPECCRLFTRNKNITKLGATYFRYPLKSLLKEIENMRMEGKANDVKGLKYVILLYILLNQARSAGSLQTKSHDRVLMSINENNIDVLAHQTLFKECYNKNIGLKVHDIMYLCEELTCRYLTRKENKIYFQHWALQDSVLISYSKINPKAIIPLLSIEHMIDIVRTQNYIEQEEEIVIKILKPNYHELAKIIISLINIPCFSVNLKKIDRLIESKIITDNDVDLTYELIVCANNFIDTSPSPYSFSDAPYIRHYFPFYLLRNIGKLDDKTLIVNHTKNQMLMSVSIKDKNVSVRVDPGISLAVAFMSKYTDIIEWLLKNTDHSLLDFKHWISELNSDRVLEYTKLILQNVKHDMNDITELFINVCCSSSNKEKHAIDWMIDNVDNSLINCDKCIDVILRQGYTETLIYLILYQVKKTNHVCFFDINSVLYKCRSLTSPDVLLKVLQNADPELFDKEELINKMEPYSDDDEDCWYKISELILPWMKYGDFYRFVEMAYYFRRYRVLEFLITHASDLSINKVKLTEKIFERVDDEDDEESGEYDYEHVETVFRLLLKCHGDNIGVAEMIIEKACNVGLHCVVEELLLDKFDNISYYLNIILGKCLSRLFDEISVSNYGGYGKLLMLCIQRVDYQFIDLNSLMSDLCKIGHSSAVLWLLENKHSHSSDLKNIMNKASYHGDRELVEYLKQKYKARNFDYKTAMIKACRNSQAKTLYVCKWLWGNIDRDLFDMKVALNNASRYHNTAVVEWILKDVDTELFDTESAIFCACENGEDDTVKLMLDTSCINMIDIQSAMILACRNEDNGLSITKLLYESADHSTIDINVVFSAACKNLRIDIVQWIIETCDQNITVTETRDGNKHLIESLDKNLIDIDRAFTCILNMDTPDQNKENDNKTKNKLVRLILNKYDPSIIHIYKLLAETSKNDWVDIFQWILIKVDNASLNIGEIINVACHNGAFDIIKWSLENIDIQLIDAGNVMVESCGSGWLECVVLIWKHCDNYKLQAAMTEACTYGRLHIAEWLLQNVHYQLFNITMLLQEAGRNGWINIFTCLLQNFHFDRSDMHIATSQALENGHLEIAELGITKIDKEGFDFSSLSENVYAGANKEAVVNFLLHNIDHRSIDIDTIMTNACLFGWKDIATFIVDNDLSSLCDLSLAFNTACDNGELEIAELLLKKIDPHILTAVDKAMLSVAVKGWDEIAVLLLDKVEHTRLDIANALIKACRQGEIDVAQTILRKVDNNMLDVETALNKACENHMHEKLVLLILENIDREQVDLKTAKRQAIRHKWRKVRFAIPELDTEDLNEAEQGIETDFIVIS